MVAIMDAHLTKNANNEDNKNLPLIYPIILYNGERPYNYSMDLFDLFPSAEKELAKDMLLSPYHLIDLTQVTDEELQKYIWFGSMALVLKHIHDPDILPFLKEILCIIKELEKYGAERYIFSMVTYIAEAGELPHQEDWARTIQDLESVDKEKLMTLMNLVEHLKPEVFKKGLEKGIEKGLVEGIEKGRHERDIEIAKALLLQGVNIETIAAATSLSKEEIKKLLS